MARSKKNVPVEEAAVPVVETAEAAEEVVVETMTESDAVEVVEDEAEAVAVETAPASPAEPAPTEAQETAEVAEEAFASDPAPQEPTQAPESGDTGGAEAPAQEDAKPPEEADDGMIHLTLSLPKAMFDQSFGSIDRLRAAIAAKQTLIKQALATDSLEVVVDAEEDRVLFPWFSFEEKDGAEATDAYSKLVFALAKKAITQTRVSSEEKPVDDPRQAMRLYLINLGFIGDEYKNARAVLMRNFPIIGGRQSVKNTSFTFSMPEVYQH